MQLGFEIIFLGVLAGVGATVFMDLLAYLQKRLFAIPPSNWCAVGRWVAYIPKGRLVNEDISKLPAIKRECSIGWTAHYIIGVIFGVSLAVYQGISWVQQPTLLPALLFGIVTVVFPFLVLQPGLGIGIAAAKAVKPNLRAPLITICGHCVV